MLIYEKNQVGGNKIILEVANKYNKVISVNVYKLYFWFSWIIVWLIYKVLWGFTVEGKENIPKDETFIILPNHCSNIDPPLVGMAVSKPIAYMAKAELFKVPILRSWIYYNGAYPVNRKSGNQAYLSDTKYALDNGWLITIFPEGGRSFDGKFMKAKSGAARVLIDSKKSFLPVALIDTHEAWGKKKKLKLRKSPHVKIGKLVTYNEYFPKEELSYDEQIEHIRKIYEQKIIELLPEKHKPNKDV